MGEFLEFASGVKTKQGLDGRVGLELEALADAAFGGGRDEEVLMKPRQRRESKEGLCSLFRRLEGGGGGGEVTCGDLLGPFRFLRRARELLLGDGRRNGNGNSGSGGGLLALLLSLLVRPLCNKSV